ncbi:MAG TPA: Pycsar system effector family protein [Allosphingosinicella sp.]|jgi:hypothetical protein
MTDEKRPFPPNAVHTLRTAQQIHVQLSQMADQKASILMGAAFVIFTLAIKEAEGARPSLPLLILGGSAFLSAVCAASAVMPATRFGGGTANLLFFGSFAQMEEEKFLEGMETLMRSEVDSYRAMARDLYQNGLVLARKKYRLLGWAYRIFLAGMTASLAAFIVQQL